MTAATKIFSPLTVVNHICYNQTIINQLKNFKSNFDILIVMVLIKSRAVAICITTTWGMIVAYFKVHEIRKVTGL